MFNISKVILNTGLALATVTAGLVITNQPAYSCEGGGNWCSPSVERTLTKEDKMMIVEACLEHVPFTNLQPCVNDVAQKLLNQIIQSRY